MFLRKKEIIKRAQEDNLFMEEVLENEETKKFIKYVIKSFTKNPARFMQKNQVEWEDLYQACMVGMLKGIKRIDLNLTPNEWVRYVYLSVQGEIRNFSRSNSYHQVSISQRIRAMYPQYIVFYQEYREKHLKDPTINETMERFTLSRNDAFDLIYGMQDTISLFKYLNENKTINLFDSIQFSYIDVEKLVINSILIESYMEKLTSKQKKVIYLHYFLGLNKTEIAKRLGCGNSMVHKHIQTAFDKIRKLESVS
jgi:RNA polymerase sigma factor (sigma-70 family)